MNRSRVAAGVVAYGGLCFFAAAFQIASDRHLRTEWALWVPVAASIDAVILGIFLTIVACLIKALIGEWPWES